MILLTAIIGRTGEARQPRDQQAQIVVTDSADAVNDKKAALICYTR